MLRLFQRGQFFWGTSQNGQIDQQKGTEGVLFYINVGDAIDLL